MYRQVYDPIADSLGWSSLFACLPLLTLFVLLGLVRVAAQWAALAALVVSLVVAIAVYSMPFGQAAESALNGAAFGLFPIMWIVVSAIWIYNMTVKTGHFSVLRRSISTVSADQRIQAIIVAFSFGALIEALAGFGTPVAISAVMLIALGFQPIKAATIALVANTAPVAFGAIATPIITLAKVTELPKDELGAMVGRQTPFLALIVPLILVVMVDGRRGIRSVWPAALLGGAVFAVGQFVTSNYISVELTDIVASLASIGAIILLLRVWQPRDLVIADQELGARPAFAGPNPPGGIRTMHTESYGSAPEATVPDSRRRVLEGYAPYAIIIAVFAFAQWGPIKSALDSITQEPNWPGINIANADGEPLEPTYKLNYLSAAGTLLLIAGLITMAVVRINFRTALDAYLATLDQLKWAIVTVAAVLGLAFVMNYSAETITLGLWAAGAGAFFAFLSPIIGWFGVAVTGSDTSSNSLFGALQVAAAKDAGLSPTLMAAANSSGGVLGKMISPQNLAIGAAAVGLAGREGDIFRRVLGWSLVLLLVMCVIAYLQSTSVLSWMVV
jgi:lactate permease